MFAALVGGLVIARLVQMPIYPLASFYAICGCAGRDTSPRPCQLRIIGVNSCGGLAAPAPLGRSCG